MPWMSPSITFRGIPHLKDIQPSHTVHIPQRLPGSRNISVNALYKNVNTNHLFSKMPDMPAVSFREIFSHANWMAMLLGPK
ncbi:hypothetical protein PFLUV_G00032380 [Perca fluviatilis]|uniref:Uncharacterized protein n=1 Tax=Perca fluviatilis TaxID=8168 RepID=A0A6A5FC49_PERFL|nr:hypothetical protein PFLUV_G00032380 [Perca fluviatilis]